MVVFPVAEFLAACLIGVEIFSAAWFLSMPRRLLYCQPVAGLEDGANEAKARTASP